MTTKERLHKLVDELSEQEADDALDFIASRHEGDGDNVDEWGDLDTFGTALMGDALRKLDEEERAELGETIAEASQHQSAA
ncbi:MAG: hypothetical protein ACRDK7_07250 [Solirubrobacteraceae bacterium]